MNKCCTCTCKFILDITYICIQCVKGSSSFFMFLSSCADIELLLFVYNFSSIKGFSRLVLLAWIFDCLFFGVFCHTREFYIYLETSPFLVKCCKFWPTLGTYGHWNWGFFSMPRLLWHGVSVYNGHIRGSLTLTPNAESLSVELSLTWIIMS